MASESSSSPALRLTFLSVVVITMFLALIARLWFLQVLAGDRYVELSDSNRLSTVVTEAPRGAILTADGEELVRNRPALAISADRRTLLNSEGEPRDEEAERVIERLGDLLEISEDEVLQRLSSQRRSPFRPVPLEFDVAPEIVLSVREHQELFPGVVAETLPVREYPQGTLAAHLVGYLGEISQDELLTEEFSDHRAGDLIGRGGLEQTYEADLRGTPGTRLLVVNAAGNVLDVQSDREPVQGNTLVTSIDAELQEATEQLLEEGIVASRSFERDDGQLLPSVAGSAIVQDARTGEIMAMASFPSYDPREFVGGLDQDYWDFITDRENYQPLINRAVAGLYPPGSVFKTASGAAMIEAGLVEPRTEIDCPAQFEVGGNTYRNWNRGVDEGPMDLSGALRRSCDTYFYDLAYQQWQREQAQDEPDEVLVRVGERFGFGRELGVDLPGEEIGRVPGREWRFNYWVSQRENYCAQAEATEEPETRELLEDLCQFGGEWRGGDAINSSIGQGDVLSTPLQVSVSYQALANDGVMLQPRIGAQIVSPDGEVVREIESAVIGDLELSDLELEVIKEGLEDVIMDNRPQVGGTASGAFESFPLDEIPIAGKTGTAEVRPRVPYAWFSSYAPADDPEIVVTVNVEEGGGGSQTAAPIALNIYEHYFGITPAEDAEFEIGEEILD